MVKPNQHAFSNKLKLAKRIVEQSGGLYKVVWPSASGVGAAGEATSWLPKGAVAAGLVEAWEKRPAGSKAILVTPTVAEEAEATKGHLTLVPSAAAKARLKKMPCSTLKYACARAGLQLADTSLCHFRL